MPPGRTVAGAMVTDVKLSGPTTSVRDLRELFADAHVHAAVVVRDGTLLAVVEPDDLVGRRDDVAAVALGRTGGRVVSPDADLEGAWELMLTTGRRRLAVADGDGTFLGLLCLKRSREGFCSDRDVGARAEEARATEVRVTPARATEVRATPAQARRTVTSGGVRRVWAITQ